MIEKRLTSLVLSAALLWASYCVYCILNRDTRNAPASSPAATSPRTPVTNLQVASSSKALDDDNTENDVALSPAEIPVKNMPRERTKKNDGSSLEVAWLASYPNSRASYVTKVVHTASHTTMASNYIKDVDRRWRPEVDVAAPPAPVPFRIVTNLELPPSYLLTHTHCSGYATVALNERDVLYEKNVEEFYLDCASGLTSHGRSFLYDPREVRKVVHLIRDPFDNVVHRFRNEGHQVRQGNADVVEWDYVETPEGFKEWCSKFDDHVKGSMGLPEDVLGELKSVPCHALFYQYILWHNNMADTIESKELDGMIMHIEEFKDDLEKATKKLFSFLDLPTVGDYPASFPKDRFRDFFTHRDREIISSFLKIAASEGMWYELERYMPVHAKQATDFHNMGHAISPLHYGKWPEEFVWLMTFPHAGGKATAHMVKAISRTTTASNFASAYQMKHRPNSSFGDAGPFRSSTLPFPERYILVETMCHDDTYVDLSFDAFISDCSQTYKYENKHMGHTTVKKYDDKLVKKVVHLIRDPFDNIIAHFHHDTANQSGANKQWPFRYTQEGLRSWCKSKDDQSTFEYSKEITLLARDIPCHSFLYKYVLWHNHAFAVPTRLKIRSLNLYYEDLYFQQEKVVKQLLDFLELEKKDAQTPVFHHETYQDSFAPKEKDAAHRFIQLVGSSETDKALARYFRSENISD